MQAFGRAKGTHPMRDLQLQSSVLRPPVSPSAASPTEYSEWNWQELTGTDRNWLYDFRFFLKFSRIVQKNLCIVASKFWGMIDPLLVAKSRLDLHTCKQEHGDSGRLWVLCHLSCLLRNNSPGTWRADRILSPLAGMFRYFSLRVAVSCCPILLVVVWVPPCFEMFSQIHPIHCLHWDIRELWRGCLILLPNSCDQNTTTKLQQYWSAQPMPAKKHHQHWGRLHLLPNCCIFLRSAAVQTRQVLQFVLWTVQAKIQKIVPKEGISQRHAKPQPEKRSWILCFLGSPAHYISNSQALQGSSYIIHDYVNDVTMPYYACKLISADLGWVTNCQMLGSRTPELHWLSQSAACRVPALSPSLRSAHLCTKACGVHPIGPLTSEKWNKLNKL